MNSLTDRFEELLHIDWGEFIELENGTSTNVDDMTLCSFIRICAEANDMAAIKIAFDRSDGLVETPVEVKVPKFYIRYLEAKDKEPGDATNKDIKETVKKYDPATAKLRETLQEMRRMPKDVIRVVRIYRKRIEKGIEVDHKPQVKSVIVANLLNIVQKGKSARAIELVFDQLDGKLTKTISLLGGNDVYIDDFSTLTAPANAIKDENGVYIAENELMTNAWLRGFANSQKGLEMLVEGLDGN